MNIQLSPRIFKFSIC